MKRAVILNSNSYKLIACLPKDMDQWRGSCKTNLFDCFVFLIEIIVYSSKKFSCSSQQKESKQQPGNLKLGQLLFVFKSIMESDFKLRISAKLKAFICSSSYFLYRNSYIVIWDFGGPTTFHDIIKFPWLIPHRC